MTYQFQYPEAFWLLLLAPLFLLLYLLYAGWKRRTARRLGDPVQIRSLLAGHSNGRSLFKFLFLLLAFVLGCLAVANPRRPDPASAEARRGIDLVIALDVSNSMKATDIAPDRLSRAQQFISRLIDQLGDDRIGLVVFAGNAYVQMPLTFDRDAARMYTATASPAAITAQGTSIGDAFQKAGLLFGEGKERYGSVLLITDGETHDENALAAAKELAARGVMINTVGIGSTEGTTILDSLGRPKRDAGGQVVISKLNEQILQEIAKTTNGVYLHLQGADAAVNTVVAQLGQIETRALGDLSMYTYETFYAWLVVPMLLLLIAELFLPDRKKTRA